MAEWSASVRRRLRDAVLAPGHRRWVLLGTLLAARARLRHAVALSRIMLQQRSLTVAARRVNPDPELSSLSFPLVDAPVVSIVIPVFNHLDTTLRCLAAVSANTQTPSFEIVIVDDCSTDASGQVLPAIAGLRYVRNPSNLGFCGSAHRGAAAARGTHIVFLNNDTLVQPGWLKPMVDRVEADASVGAVGSKLVYPDGVLQEAGGVVWSDGSAGNIGRRANPHAPEFNYTRDVDYCSAACLLVPKDLYDRVGGFDMRFAPGYYEDTDLCFAIRALGKRVVYEPRSVVVHLEGVSHGTDYQTLNIDAGKSNQYRNRQVFALKWATTLADHVPPGSSKLPTRGTRRVGPTVLVCDTRVPAADRDSGSQRMTWILRLLVESGCRVTFFPLDRERRGEYAANLERIGVEVHHGPWSLRRFARSRRGFYDVVILSRPPVGAAGVGVMRKYMPRARLLYDTVDLSWIRRQRQRSLQTGEPRRGLDHGAVRELQLMRRSDVVATVTAEEAALVERIAPTVSTIVLPNVHAVVPDTPPPFETRSGLLFIGSFHHEPNIDAALYLIKDILPLIRQWIDVQVTLVGADPPAVLRACARDDVVFTGQVGEVQHLFDNARIFVSPLRFGAGMKGKNGHAMSLGLPVVTTSIGAEGMGLVDGRHALIRETPAEFAAAVIGLYSSPELWARLSAEGRELVVAEWSPAAMSKRLRVLLRA